MNLLFLFAFGIGALISIQGPINGALRASVGSTPVFASFISSIGSMVLLGIGSVVVGERLNTFARLTAVPTWQLSGGVLGACFIFGMTLLAPRIGLATLMSLVIAGQVTGSLIFDRLGLMGLAVRELTLPRLIGAAFIVIGVLLVNFGDQLQRPQ